MKGLKIIGKTTVIPTALLTFSLTASSALAVNLTVEEQMGRHLYMDKNLSFNSTQSCATCHHRSAGFADPTNARDPEGTMVSLGDDGISVGDRNAPTSAYCGYSPVLEKNEDGEWIGGMFWDGRKTGEVLGDPLAEQAQGPPLNPVEMNMPDVTSIVQRVADSNYANLFLENYGDDFFAHVLECEEDLGVCERKAWDVYDVIAIRIADYERSAEVNPFNSPYDRNNLTRAETAGLAAFEKAGCNTCHPRTAPDHIPGALFTTYGYANIGVPNNPDVRIEPDFGLGYVKEGENGKFKIPTLRNIAKTAPYSHNGYFATLEDMVRFHINRGDLIPDVEENLVDPVAAEVAAELTERDVVNIVTFLGALTDGGQEKNGR